MVQYTRDAAGPIFEFTSRFAFNAVIVIDALREDDLQTGLTVYNARRELRDYAQRAVHVERTAVADAGALRHALDSIRQRCRDEGLRPILHFEAHGEKVSGLEVGAAHDAFSWPALESMLRPINVACVGNPGVVMAVCQGLYAIAPLKLHRHAPFYFLLGAQDITRHGALPTSFQRSTGHFLRRRVWTRRWPKCPRASPSTLKSAWRLPSAPSGPGSAWAKVEPTVPKGC